MRGPTCDFSSPLLSDSFLPYLDTMLYQVLVVEQKVLLQSGVGYAAGIDGFLHGNIRSRHAAIPQPGRTALCRTDVCRVAGYR